MGTSVDSQIYEVFFFFSKQHSLPGYEVTWDADVVLDFFQQWSPAKCLSLAQFEGGDSTFVDNWAERSDSLADGQQEYVMVRSGGQV